MWNYDNYAATLDGVSQRSRNSLDENDVNLSEKSVNSPADPTGSARIYPENNVSNDQFVFHGSSLQRNGLTGRGLPRYRTNQFNHGSPPPSYPDPVLATLASTEL